MSLWIPGDLVGAIASRSPEGVDDVPAADEPLTPERLRRDAARLRQIIDGGGPSSSRASAVPKFGPLESLPSGLLIPAGAVRGPQPLDLVGTYLIATDVAGGDPGLRWAVSTVSSTPLPAVLTFAGSLLSRIQTGDHRVVELEYAKEAFTPEAVRRIENLLRAGRVLLVPQIILVLTKLALVRSPDGGDESNVRYLPLVLLTLAEHLGASPSDDADVRRASLEREIVANQHFNRPHDVAHDTGKFTRRWLQIPQERAGTAGVLDVEALFEETTGVALRDLAILALGIWAAAAEGAIRFTSAYFSTLGWGPDRIDRALRLLAADRDALRSGILDEDKELGGGTVSWAFSPLERHPLVALPDGTYVVTSPRLVVDRVFGWLPFFDVRHGLRSSGKKSEAGRFEDCFRRLLTEQYVREVLDSLAGSASWTIYHEDNIKAAYPKPRTKIADTAIELVPPG